MLLLPWLLLDVPPRTILLRPLPDCRSWWLRVCMLLSRQLQAAEEQSTGHCWPACCQRRIEGQADEGVGAALKLRSSCITALLLSQTRLQAQWLSSQDGGTRKARVQRVRSGCIDCGGITQQVVGQKQELGFPTTRAALADCKCEVAALAEEPSWPWKACGRSRRHGG